MLSTAVVRQWTARAKVFRFCQRPGLAHLAEHFLANRVVGTQVLAALEELPQRSRDLCALLLDAYSSAGRVYDLEWRLRSRAVSGTRDMLLDYLSKTAVAPLARAVVGDQQSETADAWFVQRPKGGVGIYVTETAQASDTGCVHGGFRILKLENGKLHEVASGSEPDPNCR